MRSENPDRPPIEDLATFCLLARLGEMKQVAKHLGIDVSAVSRRMKRFQRPLGLLERQGNAWTLTERGKEALPVLERLVRDHESATNWLAGKALAPQSLVVATGSWGAVRFLPPALSVLSGTTAGVGRSRPDLSGGERILGVRDGLFDLAISSHEREQIRTLLGQIPVAVEELTSEPLALLAAAQTPSGARLARLAEKNSVPLGMLSEFELVGLDERSGVRRQLEAALRGARATLPTFGIASGGWLAAKEYARLGLGVAVVPVSVLKMMGQEGLVVRRLDIKAVRVREHLLYRENADIAALPVLCEALRAVAGEG